MSSVASGLFAFLLAVSLPVSAGQSGDASTQTPEVPETASVSVVQQDELASRSGDNSEQREAILSSTMSIDEQNATAGETAQKQTTSSSGESGETEAAKPATQVANAVAVRAEDFGLAVATTLDEAQKAEEAAKQKAAEEAAAKKAAEEKAAAAKAAAAKKTDSSAQSAQSSKGKSLGTFVVTAYCNCSKCQGGWVGKTATGAYPTAGVTIAVDPRVIPLGTKVYIDGVGTRIAQDTGGAIKGKRIDVFMSSHSEALQWGRRSKQVWIAN